MVALWVCGAAIMAMVIKRTGLWRWDRSNGSDPQTGAVIRNFTCLFDAIYRGMAQIDIDMRDISSNTLCSNQRSSPMTTTDLSSTTHVPCPLSPCLTLIRCVYLGRRLTFQSVCWEMHMQRDSTHSCIRCFPICYIAVIHIWIAYSLFAL